MAEIVINPKTKRPVKKGSAVYQKLVQEGLIHEEDKQQLKEEKDDLAEVVTRVAKKAKGRQLTEQQLEDLIMAELDKNEPKPKIKNKKESESESESESDDDKDNVAVQSESESRSESESESEDDDE